MSKSKKIVLIVLSCILIIGLLILYYFNLSIRLIGNSEVNLTIYNDYFENGYVATFFGNKISDDNVVIENNIDNTKFGDYEITYTINYLFPKSVNRIVHVIDDERPEITLQGNSTVYININDEYKEEGYKCIDNVDGDISKIVKIDSNVDSTKIGTYEIRYTAIDSSNNICEVIRNVEVIDGSILTADVADFWLDGYFEDIVLKKQEEKFEHFDEVVFVGDSNIKYLYTKDETLPAKQIWGKGNLTIAEINSDVGFYVYEHSDTKPLTFTQAMDMVKPKYLVVSAGIMCPITLSKEEFVDQIKIFVDNMRSNYPDTIFAISAIMPIAKEGTLISENQILINQFNYYLLETCHSLGVNVIYLSDDLKDESGYGKPDYFEYLADNDSGFHLNQKGRQYYVDYVSHINLDKKES